MTKVDIGQSAKVNIKWKVLPVDRTDDAEENIVTKFANKYGIPKKNITIEPIFIMKDEKGEDVGYESEIAENIQEPAFHQKLYKRYIDEYGLEVSDEDFQEIVKIDDAINTQINFDVYEKHKKYSIKWIKWSNFMSYGPDNYFDFTGLKGLVLLTSEPANQGGKTTFCLDLFRFLLFGKVTSRENDWTIAKVFNKHLPEATEVVVEGCICIDGVDYVIKRVVSRPAKRTEKSKASQKITYYRVVGDKYEELVDEDDLENEAGTTATNTNKLIKEAIGNERDFDLMICVNSDNLKGLISLKDTDRGRLISRWIGLLPLEEKDKLARERFNKTVMPSLYLNKYNKEELRIGVEDLEERNKEIVKDNTKLEKEKKAAEQKLKGFRETRDTLLQSKKQIDENLVKTDVETVKATMNKAVEDGKRKAAEKEGNEKKLKELKDVTFNEEDYKSKVAEDKTVSVRLSSEQQAYKRLGEEIDALKKGEFCPTCGARLKGVDNSANIAAKEKERAEVLQKGKADRELITKIEGELTKLEEARSKYNDKVRLELVVEKNKVDIENLRAKYRESKRLLDDIKNNEEAIRNNNKIDTSLNVIKVNIETEEKIVEEKKASLNENSIESKNNEKTIGEYKKYIEIIEKEERLVKNWKLYLEMVGKNGVSKMVLRSALPLINGELKHLLNGVCDFTVEIAIDEHNDVAFYLIHDGVKSNLGSGSGFEQTVASLALRSVLSKISSFSKPSFVVFDEILGGVADENYDQVKLLYDKIIADYAFIFQITHLKQIADWHTSHVVVKKDNNISKIEMA